MIDNYVTHPKYDVLCQVERVPFNYDDSYIQTRYDVLGEEILQSMAKLRYDLIVNTIGRRPSSILDIGYGTAKFLLYAEQQGVDIRGYDVNPTSRLPLSQRVSSIGEGVYDVITFYDSIEHVEDIGNEIMSLAPHNYVVITVPCYHEDMPDSWFRNWKHRRPDQHFWHFSPSSLIHFMTLYGYKLLYMGNPEDAIRVSGEWGRWNTMTAIFEKGELH
jgi:methyltransferase family protein